MLGVKPLLQSVQRHDLLHQPRSRRWKPNIRCHSELAVGGANYLRPEYHIGFERSGGVVESAGSGLWPPGSACHAEFFRDGGSRKRILWARQSVSLLPACTNWHSTCEWCGTF